MPNGFVKLDRKTVKSWIRRDPVAAHVFFSWFLLEAAWEPYTKHWNGIEIPLEIGQAVFGRIKVAEKLGLSEKQVRNAVNRLTQRASIEAIKRASTYSIYSVTKWEIYQQKQEQEGPALSQVVEEQGATIKELEKKLEELKKKGPAPNEPFSPPSLDEVGARCREMKYQFTDPEAFMNHYGSNGWKVGKNKMQNWHRALAGWEGREKKRANGNGGGKRSSGVESTMKFIEELENGTQGSGANLRKNPSEIPKLEWKPD